MLERAKFPVAFGLAFLAACENSADRLAQNSASEPAPAVAEGSAESAVKDSGGSAGATDALATAKVDPARVIIYTAGVSLYVDSLAETEKKLPDVLARFGAYLSGSEVSRYSGSARHARWTIRVPASSYSGLLAAVGGLGAVESSTTKADDVTAEFVDVEARLKNKREVEARLQAILKQQAGKLSEVLEVEREIARVREEIERAEGRLKFLRNQAALSTVTLDVFERAGYQPLPDEPSLVDRIKWGWRESTDALVAFSKGLVVFLVRITPWLPLFAAVFFGARFLFRKIRRRKPTVSGS